ncbi:ribosomal protein L7/L12 C-terminal domain-containing protein [Lentinula boryana]|uniref:Ribosomal protein L7/L12 C-terminal domain-containing protein n=1 Tax=Lentinula boryana TaxID=40481 RepID=A0ABQ8QJG2_9AGAR|nr:ribosomal protein L7/L12 C-terminal domain-containing protein [Lentinula boryana]
MAQASRCSGVLRSFSRSASFPSSSRTASSSRRLATAATAATKSSASPPPPLAKSSDATINRIVDDVSGLTLLQAADLVSLLKSRLNIQEIAMPAASASPAAAASAAATDEPAAEAPKEKTIFNVKLESFDATSKPKVIREVKAMNPTLTLIDAKKFVESLPQTLKENLPKEDAEKMKKAFEALGAVVVLE